MDNGQTIYKTRTLAHDQQQPRQETRLLICKSDLQGLTIISSKKKKKKTRKPNNNPCNIHNRLKQLAVTNN